jgi:protein TonB
MEAYMNIHKYLVPASIAATIHVALLWIAPESPIIRITEVPLANPPPISDPIDLPPEEPDDPTTASDPVKSLLGEPPPISLEEPPPGRIDTTMFTVPVEPARPEINVNRRALPAVIGDPSGVLNGELRPPSSIFRIDLLDGVPRAKVQIPPEYPHAMKQTGTSGTVVVEFDVDTAGQVIRAEALRYTDREFVEPALRAVRKWRFEPGRKGGKAVPFRMTVPIEFGIENS